MTAIRPAMGRMVIDNKYNKSRSVDRRDLRGNLVDVVILIFVLFMTHEADEDGREEHEDESLKEGDEEFEEGQGHGEAAGCDAHAEPSPTSRFQTKLGHGGKHDDGGEQDMAAHHVGEEADGEGHRLDKHAGKFNREDDRNHEPKALGAFRESASQVIKPTDETEFAEGVDLNSHKRKQREARGHVDIRGCGSPEEELMQAEELLKILEREQAHQVQHQNEEKDREEEWKPATGLLFSENRLDHLISKINHNDFNDLREAATRDVSLIALTVATGANSTGGEHQTEYQEDSTQNEHDFVQRSDVANLADPADIRPH